MLDDVRNIDCHNELINQFVSFRFRKEKKEKSYFAFSLFRKWILFLLEKIVIEELFVNNVDNFQAIFSFCFSDSDAIYFVVQASF